MARPVPRKWSPQNPQKYVGDVDNIVSRSSWETRVMNWLDRNPSILKWASEEMIIMYISPKDNKPHRYFPDFVIQYKTSGGEVKQAILEVKPHAQCLMPKQPKRQTQRYLAEVTTYAVNQAKWEAATTWAKKKGWEFVVITEFDLGLAKRK
jgi:hypothetical protein